MVLHPYAGAVKACNLGADTCRETYVLEGRASERHTVDISPNVAYGNLGKKWRAERNFWIAFMCFFMWW